MGVYDIRVVNCGIQWIKVGDNTHFLELSMVTIRVIKCF